MKDNGELENGNSIMNYAVRFAGLNYRLIGLTPTQGNTIRTRYSLISDLSNKVAAETNIDFQCQQFKFKSESLYIGMHGYEPLMQYSEERVDIEGLDFRGTINLNPIEGRLVCNDPSFFVSPMVCENFLRMITAYKLLQNGGLFFHSSAVEIEGKAYLFLGHSGAGKTTISRMALEFGATVLSDDANVVQPNNNGFTVDAVPFAGELGQQIVRDPISIPLAAVFIIEKASRNEVVPLSKSQRISSMLASSPVINMDPYRLNSLMENLQSIEQQIPVARLNFSKTGGFEDIYREITRNYRAAA